jgi:hypothetical protein
VLEEATDGFHGREGAGLALLGMKAHFVVVDGAKLLVRQADAMRVSTEVRVDALGSAERTLRVGDEVDAAQGAEEGFQVLRYE